MRDGLAAGRSWDELSARLGRSPAALRLHADEAGLVCPTRRRRWTAAEDEQLRTGYSEGHSYRQIAQDLPGRSVGAVTARARLLGLATFGRAWTRTDDELLCALARAGRGTPLDFARVLSRTPEAIRKRLRTLEVECISRPVAAAARSRWTSGEDQFLRLHSGLNPAELARRLGRSDRAVVNRMARLGLRDGRQNSPHHRASTPGGLTPGEQRLLEREVAEGDGRGLRRVARRLDRPIGSLARLHELRSAARPR